MCNLLVISVCHWTSIMTKLMTSKARGWMGVEGGGGNLLYVMEIDQGCKLSPEYYLFVWLVLVDNLDEYRCY